MLLTDPAPPSSEPVSEAGETLIDVKNVSLAFSTKAGENVVLDACDLTVKAGEFVCLLGPSGCGKSTLLYLIAGFLRPSSGEVSFRGRAITKPSAERMVMFQDSMQALFPWRTARSNVTLALKLAGTPRAQLRSEADRYLELVGLAGHADKYPAQLSGGMRQRLQLARCLAMKPEVLLMDEPFAALDAMTKTTMHHELLRVWRETGATIVFVTHDIAEAVLLADRIAVMERGPRSNVAWTEAVEAARPRDIALAQVGAQIARIRDFLHTSKQVVS